MSRELLRSMVLPEAVSIQDLNSELPVAEGLLTLPILRACPTSCQGRRAEGCLRSVAVTLNPLLKGSNMIEQLVENFLSPGQVLLGNVNYRNSRSRSEIRSTDCV